MLIKVTKEELKKEIEILRQDLKDQKVAIATLVTSTGELKLSLKNAPSFDTGLKSRIEDLELWRGKIHNLAIDKTPLGREKLSKHGKRIFGGGSQR